MEKVQRQRSEMIQYLQGIMEASFQGTCGEVQSELDSDACRIWHGFHDAVQECLEAAGMLQQKGKKGRLRYLAFGLMQHTLYFGKLDLRFLSEHAGSLCLDGKLYSMGFLFRAETDGAGQFPLQFFDV